MAEATVRTKGSRRASERSDRVDRSPSCALAARAAIAVGYLRRSTDRQEQSIPDQQRAVERFAAEHGYSLVRFYTDDAISGTSTVGRKAFQSLIEDAQRPGCPFAVVICYDVKRFGRIDNDEAGYYRHILKQNGVEVLYASENFTGDGTDDLLRPVKQWQARQESKDLAKVTIRGLLSKASAPSADAKIDGRPADSDAASRAAGGWWMGGAPPYGYDLRYESQTGQPLFTLRYLTDGSKQMLDEGGALQRTLDRVETVAVSKRDRCRLVPGDPVRVAVIRLIFRLYVEERRGFKSIADRLNRLGAAKAPTARGPGWSSRCSGQWATGTVRSILMNPAYKGDIAWNRRTDGRFFRIANGMAVERRGVQGRRLADNAESDWIVTEHAHPALVAPRVWEDARRLRESQATSIEQTGVPKEVAKGWRGPRAQFLLSGLCTCSACGSRYEGVRQPSTRSKEGSFAYACGGYIRKGPGACSRGALPRDGLETAVADAVVGFYSRFASEGGERLLAAEFDRILGDEAAAAHREQQDLKASAERIDRTVRNLLDNITKGNRLSVDKRLAELEAERDGVERRLRSIEQAVVSEAERRALLADVARFIRRLGTTLRTGEMEERQAGLRRCVRSIAIKRDRPAVVIACRELPMTAGAPESACQETEVAWGVTARRSNRSKTAATCR